MGMTDDYPVAVEEGATVIRVGRALFGARRWAGREAAAGRAAADAGSRGGSRAFGVGWRRSVARP